MNLLQACRWAKEIAYDLIASGEHISGKEFFKKKHISGKDNPQVMNWSSPPSGVVKVNVDAAFHEERQQGAVGRDGKGDVIAAKCKGNQLARRESRQRIIDIKLEWAT